MRCSACWLLLAAATLCFGVKAQSVEEPIPPKPTRGILWYYHIPKTGGTSVDHHIDDFLKRREGNRVRKVALWAQMWNLPNVRGETPAETAHIKARMRMARCQKALERIEAYVNSPPNPREPLLIVHQHLSCGGMVQMAPIMRRFRAMIESQGGAMHVSCLLRQPIARLVSQLNYARELTPEQWERSLLSNPNMDNHQVRFLLYNWPTQYHDNRLLEPYYKFGANLVGATDADEAAGDSISMHYYPPLGGITSEHVIAALEYLEDNFDYVGQTEQLGEYLGELEAFASKFIDTSAWQFEETRSNVQGVNVRLDPKVAPQIHSWREAPPFLQELLITRTSFDAELHEEAMKLKLN
ncbi:unnamed protein product [Chrysoparadoxa australica]